VAIGPEPVATLELVADLPGLRATRGNTDRYVLTRDRPPPSADDVRADPGLVDRFTSVEASFSWTRGALTATGWLDWTAALPLEADAVLPDGTRVLAVHASPGRDDGDGITPDRPHDELLADLVGADADLVFAGHTHQPTDRHLDGVHAVNLGSVSNPITDDLRAAYVIIHADRHAHAVEHRRVDYDHDAFLAALDRSAHPAHDFIASFQRGDQVRYAANRPGAPVVT
jgi:diadenosine tetraphosphatase ApaH/serine/threonine PP2A family protein phosphatase